MPRIRGRTGVLDAGVVLARLDRRHPASSKAEQLLRRSSEGQLSLHISIVNLAEVLQHAFRYSAATGLDLVAFLRAFKVGLHSPDVEVARRCSALASLEDLSLADRFAAATSELLGARLYTTDSVLAAALKRRNSPVTLF